MARKNEVEQGLRTTINSIKSNADCQIEEAKTLAEKELRRAQAEDTATMTRNLYEEFLAAGFTEEQAWTLTLNMVTAALKV